MPFINTKDEEKYKIVDEILSAPNYYRVLGVQKHATTEDIRRAYIKKSRICHPDKFVPSYPAATESFQILSMAYETLSNPALKSIYDVSKPVNQSPKNYSSGYKQSNAEATFSNVLHQLYTELSTGEFQLIRSFIYVLNETNPNLHISEDAIHQIELGLTRMSDLFNSSKQYYHVIRFELLKLYELQQELRSLSYFSVWKRMKITISMCKILLQLPILISAESKQQQLLKSTPESKGTPVEGILNQKIENALQMAVNMLEAGERYTKSW